MTLDEWKVEVKRLVPEANILTYLRFSLATIGPRYESDKEIAAWFSEKDFTLPERQ